MNVQPLRSALLSLAEEDAVRALAVAEERAAAEVARSQREADALVEQARAEGETAAEREAARVRAQARTEARALVLRARREIYDELVSRAQAGALELRGDPSYSGLLERLAAAARARLGQDAELELDPAGHGGVVGHRGRRRVDYSLPVLVESSLERLGPRVEELWS